MIMCLVAKQADLVEEWGLFVSFSAVWALYRPSSLYLKELEINGASFPERFSYSQPITKFLLNTCSNLVSKCRGFEEVQSA